MVIAGVFMISSCNSSAKKTDAISTEQKQTDTTAVPPASPSTTLHEDKKYSKGELEFLRDYAEKYPADVKLLENESFTKRLKALTGNRYQFLKETWAVETPMALKGDIFTAEACMAHNCGSTNFIVVIDLASDKMYAGIRQDDKVKLYGEDANHPQALKDWQANK